MNTEDNTYITKKVFYGWLSIICIYISLIVNQLPDNGWKTEVLFLFSGPMAIVSTFMSIKYMLKPKQKVKTEVAGNTELDD